MAPCIFDQTCSHHFLPIDFVKILHIWLQKRMWSLQLCGLQKIFFGTLNPHLLNRFLRLKSKKKTFWWVPLALQRADQGCLTGPKPPSPPPSFGLRLFYRACHSLRRRLMLWLSSFNSPFPVYKLRLDLNHIRYCVYNISKSS